MKFLAALVTSLLLLVLVAGCATAVQSVRTLHVLAHDLCVLHFGERQGISARDAARLYCATEDQLKPWLDELTKARAAASSRSSSKDAEEGGAPQ